jgi:hypothetical protein
MIESIVLANALATVVGAGYILCRLVSAVAPELLFRVGQSWLHTVNLAPLRTTSPMPTGMFALGRHPGTAGALAGAPNQG